MNFLSTFSGIGGFDLGFEQSGMTCVSQVEIDKHCQNILRRHFPNTSLYDDVRKVGEQTHEPKSVDVICGGFPCQDVSIAGNRAGLAGSRSGLWFELARIIDELEPKWFIGENVPGLLSSNKGRDFAVIIRWLAERGYGVAWRVLDSQYFGVAQERRRLFVVASLGSGSASRILFDQSNKGEVSEILSQAHTATILTRYSQRWDDSETIIRETDGDRWLTPLECERLFGFPDNWTDGQSKTRRYFQLGNSIAPPVAKWMGDKIMEIEKERTHENRQT